MRPASAAGRSRPRRFGRFALVLGLVLSAAGLHYVPPTLRSLAVLSAGTGMYGAGVLTQWVSQEVSVAESSLALPRRTLRDRVYAPRGVARPPVAFVLHGVHPRGIDEPRLRSFAAALASAGLEVHTPELPELAAFRAEPRLIAEIAGCAAALQRANGGRKVGAFGISFAGGLLLVAAESPKGRAALDYVVAVGAHHDLHRLARYYAGAALPRPEGAPPPPRAPHPYAGRVLAGTYAEQLFGAEAGTAREALALHLAERYREAAEVRARLSPAAQARFAALLASDPALRPLLLAAADRHAAAFAALSPAGRLAGLRVPVYLLHGQDDPIVPSSETAWLEREVPEAWLERVLVTPALRHAEGADAPSALDVARLVAFLADVLREADD